MGKSLLIDEVGVVLVEEPGAFLVRGICQLRHLLEVLLTRRARREEQQHLGRGIGVVAESVQTALRHVQEVALCASTQCAPSKRRTVPSRM